MSACNGCDGSGWYVPTYSTAVLVNCVVCNDDLSKPAGLDGAAWRAAKALGYRRLITYTLNTEPGTSLRGAGWKCLGERGGGSWNVPSRPRVDKHPLQIKMLWEAVP